MNVSSSLRALGLYRPKLFNPLRKELQFDTTGANGPTPRAACLRAKEAADRAATAGRAVKNWMGRLVRQQPPALDELLEGALEQSGWLRSHECGRPVDRNGSPVPYITISAANFLRRRITPDMEVFEYGAGNGTLWWAARVKRVISVEHDHDRHRLVAAEAPPNVELHYIPHTDAERYAGFISTFDKRFDIVVIDGRERIRCAMNAIEALRPDGVIIWDNSDLGRYTDAFEAFEDLGFRRLEFSGFAPGSTSLTETSVLYRRDNCLNI